MIKKLANYGIVNEEHGLGHGQHKHNESGNEQGKNCNLQCISPMRE